MLKLRKTASFCAVIFVFSCHVTAADQDGSASLLHCSDRKIGSFNLTSHRDSTLMSGILFPEVVDYHFKNKVFFWSDSSDIYRAPLWQEGARPSVLIRGVYSEGLAVDWIHNLLYWTNNRNSAVEVARLDGSMKRTLFEEEGILPRAIVLNPAEGFMIWSDCGNVPKIERWNMGGSNRKVIVKEDISSPISLAIDLGSRRIFWVDFYENYLSSSNFDGSQRRNPITQLKHPMSLDVYGQYVYFVTREYNHEAIHKASKVDGSGLTKVFDDESSRYSLKIYDPSKQLEGYNVCGDNNGGCSHLCLPTSAYTFSCACPNYRNMSRDNLNCLNSDGSEATTPSSTSTSSQLPFTVIQPNFTSSTGSAEPTPSLTTNSHSSQLPFTVSQNNFTSSAEENKNKNFDTSSGSSGIHGTLAVVIASAALIAMVGMMIYFRQFLITNMANADTKNLVPKKNAEENMYMEALS